MTEAPTETQWYIARDGAQHGPLSDAEIRMFVQSGHMRSTDLVWRPGFADWQPATTVFPPAPAPAANSPTPSPAAKPPSGQSASEASQTRPRPAAAASAPAGPDAAGSGSPNRTAQDHVRASGRPAHQEPGVPAAGRAAPTSSGTDRKHVMPTGHIDEEHDPLQEEQSAPKRRFAGRAAGVAIAAVTLLGGGGWLVAHNQDAILAMANMAPPTTAGVPVVEADEEIKTAALDKEQPQVPSAASEDESASDVVAPAPTPVAAETPQRPSVTPQMIDENFQRSPLWKLLKVEYPDWYNTNVEEAARIVSAGTEADMAKHLIVQLVALRREHAEHALAADTASLIKVAEAFLANLKSLASHSASTCYSFIGQGESSPAVIELFPQRGYGEAIEAQIASIFEAVSSGRKAPISRVRATKSDYDVLAAELTKLGWSKADLRVFADPKALAQTEPEKVCQMVQDWFTAHLAITDASVQERLMFETLRPIVAG